MTPTTISERSSDRLRPATGRALLCIIGPAGVGKSTLAAGLAARGLVRVHLTFTTRPRRHDEPAGGALDHCFVSDGAFDRLERDGYFVAVGRLPGLPHRYGLPALGGELSGNAVDTVATRAAGVPAVARLAPDVVVYQVTADRTRLATRLMARGGSEAERATRMAALDAELAAGQCLAHRVFRNDGDLEDLVADVTDAMTEDFVHAGSSDGTRVPSLAVAS